MVLVLIVGGFSGWAANKIRTQRAAVATMKAAKGAVTFDWQREFAGTVVGPNGPRRIRRTEPTTPRWVRRILGDELFQTAIGVYHDEIATPATIAATTQFDRVETVNFYQKFPIAADLSELGNLRHLHHIQISPPAVTDASIGQIARIASLRSLNVSTNRRGLSSPASDTGFAQLASLSNLESLSLRECPNLTDAGAAVMVAGMPKLKTLDLICGIPAVNQTLASLARNHPDLTSLGLDRSGVRDEDLRMLQGLPQLQYLRFQGAKITGIGLAHLRPLRNLKVLMLNSFTLRDEDLLPLAACSQLESLNLSFSLVTDAGLDHLAPLTRLTILHLDRTKITDAGLPALARLPNLEYLTLRNLPITDTGLMALAKLTKLTSLEVSGTKVTPAGVISLQLAIPALTTFDLRNAAPTGGAKPANPLAPK